MGGPRCSPGKITAERIVHLDTPELRKKYEKLEADLVADHQAKIERVQFQVAAIRSEHGVTLKALAESQAECRRLGNIQPSTDQAKPVFHSPDEKEMERLRLESKSLRETLGLANESLRKLLSEKPAVPEALKPTRVVEVKDRIIYKVERRVTAIAASVAFVVGLASGHGVHSESCPKTILVSGPAPMVVKKAAEVRK